MAPEAELEAWLKLAMLQLPPGFGVVDEEDGVGGTVGGETWEEGTEEGALPGFCTSKKNCGCSVNGALEEGARAGADPGFSTSKKNSGCAAG